MTTRVPDWAQRVAVESLLEQPAHRRELFLLRLDRWWGDLCDSLTELYGETTSTDLLERLIRLAAAAYAERDPDLARLDQVRTLEPDWFQGPQMVGYAAYVDRFAGDLPSLVSRIPYLRELGVTYLHLMPLLKPRDGENDGGYAIADYRSVRPDLGSFDDLRRLSRALRADGISLVLDLVLNHVAREHEWAARARQGSADHRSYFHIYPDREQPDAFEQTLPEVFPDFAPGSFTWDDEVSGWVWTTFNSWQWDLDWANPQVLYEFADLVLVLANAGVEVLRLDAIAFLWKRLGTNCQNQPEVHAITQALRAVARIACPALIFKAEAIVGPAELVDYLGQGRRHGKVSDLAYHNSLMVQIWSMLATGDVTLTAHALRNPPPPPASTAWITYIRCHDDIGWAIDDRDAAAVGLNGFAHRSFLADYYAGEYPASAARGLLFQQNPLTLDRRISGMTASLAGLEAGLERGDLELVDQAVRRILLAYTIAFGWGGIPVIWSGDELAVLNDPDWATEPGHESDNRWAHRPRLPWDTADRRHDQSDVTGQIFAGLTHLVAVRARTPHLHASIRSEVLEPSDPGILPVLRRHPTGNLLELYNISSDWRAWPLDRVTSLGLTDVIDLLSNTTPTLGGDGQYWLPPYTAWWLVNADDVETVPRQSTG